MSSFSSSPFNKEFTCSCKSSFSVTGTIPVSSVITKKNFPNYVITLFFKAMCPKCVNVLDLSIILDKIHFDEDDDLDLGQDMAPRLNYNSDFSKGYHYLTPWDHDNPITDFEIKKINLKKKRIVVEYYYSDDDNVDNYDDDDNDCNDDDNDCNDYNDYNDGCNDCNDDDNCDYDVCSGDDNSIYNSGKDDFRFKVCYDFGSD